LLTLVKTLTPAQKARLCQELNEEKPHKKGKDNYIKVLLNGPVYSEKDIAIIEENRISIVAWRTKN